MIVLRSILVLLVGLQGIVPVCPCPATTACRTGSARMACCATTAAPSSACTIANPCCCGAKTDPRPVAATRSESSPKLDRTAVLAATALIDLFHDGECAAPARLAPRDLTSPRPSQATLQVFRI